MKDNMTLIANGAFNKSNKKEAIKQLYDIRKNEIGALLWPALS